MAHKAIREYDGKRMLTQHLPNYLQNGLHIQNRCLQVKEDTDLEKLVSENPWVLESKLVAKPDQLIKRRGMNNLILLNSTWDEVVEWIFEHMKKPITVDGVTGMLKTFIVEPFLPHCAEDECYLAIQSVRKGDEILFFHRGGVAIGDVDSKAERIAIPVREEIEVFDLKATLLKNLPSKRQEIITEFIRAIFKFYVDAEFTLLEINPLVIGDGKIELLDLAAKLDDTAEFECGDLWGEITFPVPFGREATEEERYVNRLDAQSGASLKFSLLKPQGRVWTMIAGGGASVVYTDTVADLGYGEELANYGEYSGNPTEEESYEYAKTILDLMTRAKDPQGRGKVLLIGGGIANFTDVAKTFGGVCKALREYAERLKQVDTKIYVRRGGPNYQEGLELMENLGRQLGIPIKVYGPETHMTKIVSEALTA